MRFGRSLTCCRVPDAVISTPTVKQGISHPHKDQVNVAGLSASSFASTRTHSNRIKRQHLSGLHPKAGVRGINCQADLCKPDCIARLLSILSSCES